MRVESNVKIYSSDDDKIYSFVKTKYLYGGWNPFKVKEYSYRIIILQRSGGDTAHITHGLFEDGIFYSGQCI